MGSEAPTGDMMTLDRFKEEAEGLGFARVESLPGATFRPAHVAIVCPLRSPMIHNRVAQAIQNIQQAPNQGRGIWFPHGHEVGHAYNETLKAILADPNVGKWPYLMTVEDDQLPPPNAFILLAQALEATGFDAVSGTYFTKGDYGVPQTWGDANEYRQTGVLNFRPVDPLPALRQGATVLEVNGIGMGCAVWRMGLFREMPPPWFVTTCEWSPEKGGGSSTQDLHFCANAKRAGKRFGVDLRVKVGHMDIASGIVY